MSPGRHYSRELVVTLVCLAVIAAAGLYLYFDFTRKGAGDRPIVGSVEFQLGVNSRRPAGRVTWGRLERGDPVHRDDTVRTADESEALLALDDGTVVEMDPLSMIVLNIRDEHGEIDVLRGSVLIRAGARGRWRMKGQRRSFAPGETRRFSADSRGNAAVENIQGPATSARAPDANGPRPLAPPENRRYFTDPPGATDGRFVRGRIDFRWAVPPASRVDGKYRLLVSRDPAFARAVVEREVAGMEARADLAPGRYYWRVLDAKGRPGAVRGFSVIERDPPRLIAPAAGIKITAGEGRSPVVFAWRGPPGASYRLEVASETTFADPLVRQQVHRTGITLRLPPGRYHWRLTALGFFPESHARSPTRFFVVSPPTVADARDAGPNRTPEESRSASGESSPGRARQDAREQADGIGVDAAVASDGTVAADDEGQAAGRVAPPRPIFPEFLMPLDMSRRDSILFRWSGVPGAEAYLLRLYNMNDGVRPVFALRTAAPALNFTRLDLLDEGEFMWTVDAALPDGRLLRGQSRFLIHLSERPERPELE